MGRQPRFRDWVRYADLSALLKAHEGHCAAAEHADTPMQAAWYFLGPGISAHRGQASQLYFCDGPCAWCDAAQKRFKRVEDTLHRALSVGGYREG